MRQVLVGHAEILVLACWLPVTAMGLLQLLLCTLFLFVLKQLYENHLPYGNEERETSRISNFLKLASSEL